MTARRPVLVAFLAALALVATGVVAPRGAATLETFDRSELVIVTETGRHKFSIELAVNGKQRAQGLMYRRDMPADHGMLFDYRRPQEIAMWMKNTFIPLDMVFLDATGTVKGTHERAVPQSLETIDSPGPVRAVLEVNGGTVKRLKIKPGDKVEHPLFDR